MGIGGGVASLQLFAMLIGKHPMALSKKNIISSKKEIDMVFKNGRTVKSSFLFIRFVKNFKEYSRFAFIFPAKHISLAVNRNRAKRLFSEEAKHASSLFKGGYDIIVGVAKKVSKDQIKNLAVELRTILSKISR